MNPINKSDKNLSNLPRRQLQQLIRMNGTLNNNIMNPKPIQNRILHRNIMKLRNIPRQSRIRMLHDTNLPIEFIERNTEDLRRAFILITNAKNTRLVSARVCVERRFSLEFAGLLRSVLREDYPTVLDYVFSEMWIWIFIIAILKNKNKNKKKKRNQN